MKVASDELLQTYHVELCVCGSEASWSAFFSGLSNLCILSCRSKLRRVGFSQSMSSFAVSAVDGLEMQD